MKSTQLILTLFVLSLLTTSCYKRNHWGIKGKGSNVTESRSAGTFDRIHLSIDADVFYSQDPTQSIEITGQANILSVLETKVERGTLKIDYKRDVWDHNRVKIIIHTPHLKGVSISGSGDFRAENKLSSDHLDLNISGSGNIVFPELEAEFLSAKISGSGNMRLDKGSVKSEDFSVSGSGDIDAEFLICSSNQSKISGSGNIIVNVTEDLEVKISGSGDLKYRGTPSVSADISGSGKLLHLK